MTKLSVIVLALATAAPLVVSVPVRAQEDSQEWLDQCRHERTQRERSCEIRTETFHSTGSLHVDAGRNGGVSVESWSGTEVSVEARVQAQAEDAGRAAAIGKGVRAAHSGGSLVASGPADLGDNESWSVQYVVKVPRATNLDLVASNGPLSVHNVRGNISASTVNGPLALVDVAGDVKARTRNGPLSVRLGGVRWEGAGLDAETSNGPVTLSLPEYYNADLETGTTNGPFNTEIPLSVQVLGRNATHINTKLGDGGAPVRVITTNGPIVIRRR